MKADIVNASITSIDSNPFRSTAKYPFVKSKVEALKRSIDAVGMWEGVIVRKRGNRYELAFGHHRVEAARQLGMTRVPVIVRDLDEEQMLQFMGRENGEDYNADFLCTLETWEAGVKFLTTTEVSKPQAIDVARLLGWSMAESGRHSGDRYDKMNMTAAACNAAHALIKGGHMSRSDLADMGVKAAREIVERAYSRMKQVDKMAKSTGRSVKEVERTKTQIAKAAQSTAKAYRDGKISSGKLRDEVDSRAYEIAAKSKVKDSPLFAAFADTLIKQIGNCMVDDGIGARLEQVLQGLNNIVLESDFRAVEKLQLALRHHEKVTADWQVRLTPKREKVVNLRALPGKK